MKRRLILALLLSFYSFLSRGADHPQPFWSQDAKVFEATKGGYKAIFSPDGEIGFSFDGQALVFRNKRGDTLATLRDSISTPDLVETDWSSNSKEVFVNTSDGGASGTWHTRVFQRSKSSLHEIPVESLIKRISALRTDCQFKNVSAIAWVDAHHDLLVLEQVPDSSGCSNMGALAGYVVNISTLKVLERLNARQVKARFHAHLGNQGQAAVE